MSGGSDGAGVGISIQCQPRIFLGVGRTQIDSWILGLNLNFYIDFGGEPHELCVEFGSRPKSLYFGSTATSSRRTIYVGPLKRTDKKAGSFLHVFLLLITFTREK